jgi:hypothetical protein
VTPLVTLHYHGTPITPGPVLATMVGRCLCVSYAAPAQIARCRQLAQSLMRLVTPPGGTVLDPFAGSGTTGEAALREGFRAVLIEREAEYVADIKRRLGRLAGADAPLFAAAEP